MRLILALLALALTLAPALPAKPDGPAKRPNFVFILVDDMGYGDVGAHGNKVIKTPNIDRLHGESIRFTNFCVSPSCSPTRAALMSGKHEFKVDVSHTNLGRNQMALEAVTIANVMQNAGYATGLFGKWHLGMKPGCRPHSRGFDVGLTDAQDSQNHHYDPVLQCNGKEEKHQGYRTDIFFNEAMKWIEEKKDEPFFCYIPTYSPHSPLIVPDKYTALYPNHEKEVKQFLGMMTNVDENIGRLRKQIEKLGLKEKTVIILINDNGGTWGVDVDNAGMRGRKGSTLYGGIRAVSFWAWPGQWKPAEHDHMTGHIDVFPTIAECAGIDLKPELRKSLDGVSMMSLIDSSRAKSKTDAEILKDNDRMMVAHRARWSNIEGKTNAEVMEDSKYSYCSVRWRHYIAVRIKHCGNATCETCNKIRDRWQDVPGKWRPYTSNVFHYMPPEDKWMLHDLKADLSQESDIAAQKPELLKRMADHYEAWWDNLSVNADGDENKPPTAPNGPLQSQASNPRVSVSIEARTQREADVVDHIEQPRDVMLKLTLRGIDAVSASRYGMLQITEATGRGHDQVVKPMVLLKSQFFPRMIHLPPSRGDTSKRPDDGFSFELDLNKAGDFHEIEKLKGSLKLQTGGKWSELIIPRVTGLDTMPADAADKFEKSGIKAALEHSDDTRIKIIFTNGRELIQSVELTDSAGRSYDGGSRTIYKGITSHGGKTWYTFTRSSGLPSSAQLKITFVTGAQNVSVPFKLNNIPVTLPTFDHIETKPAKHDIKIGTEAKWIRPRFRKNEDAKPKDVEVHFTLEGQEVDKALRYGMLKLSKASTGGRALKVKEEVHSIVDPSRSMLRINRNLFTPVEETNRKLTVKLILEEVGNIKQLDELEGSLLIETGEQTQEVVIPGIANLSMMPSKAYRELLDAGIKAELSHYRSHGITISFTTGSHHIRKVELVGPPGEPYKRSDRIIRSGHTSSSNHYTERVRNFDRSGGLPEGAQLKIQFFTDMHNIKVPFSLKNLPIKQP